jgi:hypothetical protein
MRRESLTRAYLQGALDENAYAICVLKRGVSWHLRDWLTKALRRMADRIEPSQPPQRRL